MRDFPGFSDYRENLFPQSRHIRCCSFVSDVRKGKLQKIYQDQLNVTVEKQNIN